MVKKSIIFLLCSWNAYAVNVGDQIRPTNASHPYFDQVGVVVKIETGGNTTQAKIDFDGDGEKDAQVIVEYTWSYEIVNDPNPPPSGNYPIDWSYEKTRYYLIVGNDYWGGASDYILAITYEIVGQATSEEGGMFRVKPKDFFINNFQTQLGQIIHQDYWKFKYSGNEIALYASDNRTILNNFQKRNFYATGSDYTELRFVTEPPYGNFAYYSVDGPQVSSSISMYIGVKGVYSLIGVVPPQRTWTKPDVSHVNFIQIDETFYLNN